MILSLNLISSALGGKKAKPVIYTLPLEDSISLKGETLTRRDPNFINKPLID